MHSEAKIGKIDENTKFSFYLFVIDEKCCYLCINNLHIQLLSDESTKPVMNLRLLLLLFLFSVLPLGAQTPTDSIDGSWQTLWHELMNDEESEDNDDWSETFELLQSLSEHPLDLNSASRSELEQLPFLSEQQVMDLIEYRDHYGPLRSMGELRMVRSMDYTQLQLLPCFVYVGEVVEQPKPFPRLSTILRYGRHELLATGRIPMYERKGDDPQQKNGYLGYPYKHALRYDFSYGDYVRLGVVGAQDAGEPFFSHNNRWGYDAYSYYFIVRKLGPLNEAVVGKYKLSAGMGLVLNNSFSLGKVAMLQNMGRSTRSIRVHASGSEADYFQGAAANVQLCKPLSLLAFVSYRSIDATLNADDGSAATLITSGYHRTPTEIGKKYNTHLSSTGLGLQLRSGGFHAGATAVYTSIDRELKPKTSTLYRRYAAAGRHFFNASIDYGYTHYRLAFNGETAIDGHGAIATLNTLSFQPSSSLRLMALQRFYSYRYASLHAHAFSEGGHVQNESGVYLGGTWQLTHWMQLLAYADYAYFPWARYRVSQSSVATDYLGELTLTPSKRWTIKGRYRLHRQQLDNEKKTALRRHNQHRLRLSAAYSFGEWNFSTQADGVRTADYEIEQGYMLSERIQWKHRWWQLWLQGSWFHTDSYNSRLYAYERQLPHQFAVPSFYGRGFHFSFVASAAIGKAWLINAKVGHTHYSDRSIIGSGMQQINANHQTDLDLQLRFRW